MEKVIGSFELPSRYDIHLEVTQSKEPGKKRDIATYLFTMSGSRGKATGLLTAVELATETRLGIKKEWVAQKFVMELNGIDDGNDQIQLVLLQNEIPSFITLNAQVLEEYLVD